MAGPLKRAPIAWSALLVGSVVFVAASPWGRADPDPHDPGESALDCGTLALYHLLHLEGRPTDLTVIRSHLPAMPPAGYSMKELRDAARACGLQLSGLQPKDPIRELDRPMIAFLRQGHYIVARPVGHTGKQVQILNGAVDSTIIDKQTLLTGTGWTGLVLAPKRSSPVEWWAVPSAALAGLVLAIRLIFLSRSSAGPRSRRGGDCLDEPLSRGRGRYEVAFDGGPTSARGHGDPPRGLGRAGGTETPVGRLGPT